MPEIHPIENRIGCVFVPVSNMARAIGFYSRLLNVPEQNASHEGNIYNVPMAGETQLILDGHREVQNSSQPLLFFWTTDIRAARNYVIESGIEIVSEIEDIGSLRTCVFHDPDGNLLMLAERK